MERKKENILGKGILIILLIILAILIGCYVRSFVLLQNYDKTIKEYSNRNYYYAKAIDYKGDYLNISKTNQKGNEKTVTMILIEENNTQKMIETINSEGHKIIIEKNGIKAIEEEKEGTETMGLSSIVDVLEKQETNNLMVAFSIRNIKTEQCNGKSCYKITLNKGKMVWLEKESYIPVRVIEPMGNNEKNTTRVTDYEFNYENPDE